MKNSILLVALLSCFGCAQGGGSGGSSAPQIEGTDLTGSYRMAGIECYDSSFASRTAVGTIAAASPTGTMTIKGNTAISESVTSGGCRVDTTRTFVATLQGGTRASGVGTIKLGATTAVIASNATCSATISFDMTSGSLTPASVASSYSPNQAIPAQETSMVVNTNVIAITSIFQVVSRPTDICLMIYQKL